MTQTDHHDVNADLTDLDIENGECVNSTIPQNVTFGEQGGVLDSGNGAVALSLGRAQYAAAVVATLVALVVSLL